MPSAFDPDAIWVDGIPPDKANIRSVESGLGKVAEELGHGGYADGLSPAYYQPGDGRTISHLEGIDTELQSHFASYDSSDYTVTAFQIGVDGRAHKEFRTFAAAGPTLIHFPAGLPATANGVFQIIDGQTAIVSSDAGVLINNVDLSAATITLQAGMVTWFRRQVDDIILVGPIDGVTAHQWGDIDLHGNDLLNAANLLQPGDVDDVPVDGATAVPISSNWAFDFDAATTSALSAKAPLDSPVFTTAVTVPPGSISYAEIQDVSAEARVLGRAMGAGVGDITELTAAQLNAIVAAATLAFAGQLVTGNRAEVLTGVTGALTTAAHSGRILVTSGNHTVPNGAGDVGFNAVIIAGGAHTTSFNSTATAAMAAGDMRSVVVQSTTQIRSVTVAAADQDTFA